MFYVVPFEGKVFTNKLVKISPLKKPLYGIVLCSIHRDTAGQERFNSIRTSFFRGAKVCVCVYVCVCVRTCVCVRACV